MDMIVFRLRRRRRKLQLMSREQEDDTKRENLEGF
jgi:hypothetical protein